MGKSDWILRQLFMFSIGISFGLILRMADDLKYEDGVISYSDKVYYREIITKESGEEMACFRENTYSN